MISFDFGAEFQIVRQAVLMARLLAGLGVPFIVHRPRELCDVVRQYARTLASYAELMPHDGT